MAAEDLSPVESGGMLLSTVEDVFYIEGRGCVVVPGVPSHETQIFTLRQGVPITLHKPDGSVAKTAIQEVEMFWSRVPRLFLPVLLPTPITKADVPIGTELWYFPLAIEGK